MSALKAELRRRVLVLDGAMGALLQAHGKSGNLDALCLTEPELVAGIHREYLEAGADIIETNTFNSNRLSQLTYGMAAQVADINMAAARIAREAVRDFAARHPGSPPRFVAGAMGPTALSASAAPGSGRHVPFRTLTDAYAEQAAALILGGVDALLVETAFDLRNIQAALEGISLANREESAQVPFMVSMTISPASGRLLSGHTLPEVLATLSGYDLLALGLNCCSGPRGLTSFVKELAELSPFPVILYPNAGLPDSQGRYSETPESLSTHLRPLLKAGYLNIAGGCCGATPEHIRVLCGLAHSAPPHTMP